MAPDIVHATKTTLTVCAAIWTIVNLLDCRARRIFLANQLAWFDALSWLIPELANFGWAIVERRWRRLPNVQFGDWLFSRIGWTVREFYRGKRAIRNEALAGLRVRLVRDEKQVSGFAEVSA